jgi:hypothetical protein
VIGECASGSGMLHPTSKLRKTSLPPTVSLLSIQHLRGMRLRRSYARAAMTVLSCSCSSLASTVTYCYVDAAALRKSGGCKWPVKDVKHCIDLGGDSG